MNTPSATVKRYLPPQLADAGGGPYLSGQRRCDDDAGGSARHPAHARQVTIPALIGPLLGPVVGGLIVHWLSWREIFFVNAPVGLAALLSWLLEVYSEHRLGARVATVLAGVALGLLAAYGWHSRQTPYPSNYPNTEGPLLQLKP